jgi:hypothetical protein
MPSLAYWGILLRSIASATTEDEAASGVVFELGEAVGGIRAVSG